MTIFVLSKYPERDPLNLPNQRPGSQPENQIWAPWWWYLIAIIPTNLIRTALMRDDAPLVAVVAVFVVVTVGLIAGVTAVFRATHREKE